MDKALEYVRERFEPDNLPTAFLTANDTLALAVLLVAREAGIGVPSRLSVMGFNDQSEAAASTPSLTTVRVPRVQLAREAVEFFLRIAGDRSIRPEQHVLNCRIVERQSVAAAAD